VADAGDQGKPVALDAVTGRSRDVLSMVAACSVEDVVHPDDCVLKLRLRNSEKLAELDSLLGHLPEERVSEVLSCSL